MTAAIPSTESLPEAPDLLGGRHPADVSYVGAPSLCIACGECANGVSISRRHAWLRRCENCGLQFADPQPSESDLAAIYGANYYRAFGWSSTARDAYQQMTRCRAEKLLRYAESAFRPSSLLDVGSGLGNLLWVARERGWEVHGVDRNPYAAERANEFVPGATVACEIEHFASRGVTFGLVTMLDVIEHLRRPDEILQSLYDSVEPGGGIVISTLDAECLAAKLLGSRWPLYIREHLWYFTRSTLTAIVERAGFQILECSRAKKAFTLHYLLSILSQPQQAPAIRWPAAVALKLVPGWIARRMFTLREGLFLMARK